MARLPQASETRHVNVGNGMVRQGGGQRIRRKVRMAPRAGNGPHVGDAGDAMRLQEREELGCRACGMSDGEDLPGCRHTVAGSVGYTSRASIVMPGNSRAAASR